MEDEWNGAKPLPAKGEYLITQPTKSFLIQVTPANYDLSTLDLKLVNTKGEEAPVVLGKPAPFVGDLSVQPRAVSTSGIFEVTVDSKDFSAETIPFVCTIVTMIVDMHRTSIVQNHYFSQTFIQWYRQMEWC